jgi:hypothetical protein
MTARISSSYRHYSQKYVSFIVGWKWFLIFSSGHQKFFSSPAATEQCIVCHSCLGMVYILFKAYRNNRTKIYINIYKCVLLMALLLRFIHSHTNYIILKAKNNYSSNSALSLMIACNFFLLPTKKSLIKF